MFLNLFDILGWRAIAFREGRAIPGASLAFYHLASEAIARSIPLGAPIADSVRSLLLKREYEVPIVESATGSLMRRWSLGVTQCSILTVGTLVGFSEIRTVSVSHLHNESLAWILISFVVVMIGVLVGLMFIVQRGNTRVISLPISMQTYPAFHWLNEKLVLATSTVHANGMGSLHNRRLSFLWFIASWMIEIVETYLLLTVLGFEVTFQQAFAIETLVSALRLAGFFLPSGIGVQETGYAAVMAALAISSPWSVGTFLLAKRGRDIFWIFIGYAILFAKGIIPSRKRISLQLTEA